MFTGIIENIGTIQLIAHRGNYTLLTIKSELASDHMKLGDSVSCDGACLTVTSLTTTTFVVEASQETHARTIAGNYRTGSRINLELALRADGRLDGHFVTGHVDCIGEVVRVQPIGESLELSIAFDRVYDPLVVEKGSIALNGVSLTINEVADGHASVNLIPLTLSSTTLGQLKTGGSVNIEFDIIGKYIARRHDTAPARSLTMKKLLESGW
jgi:riboflavin synthase